jgi:2-polyprenyl-3-methyl-5-hydroxy-6-metoxy-1,4-benzoquinol methylase
MSYHHVCPVWVGYLLANPIRRVFQNPEKILSPHVTPGMRVLDVGSAMGFFSLPMARLVGPSGRVVCVDLQQKMLDTLARRARRAEILDRIEARLCTVDSLCITDLHSQIHLALVFAVVHEIDNPTRFFSEVHHTLTPGGRVLFAEPKGHVRGHAFDESLSMAERTGLRKIDSLRIPWSHAALLEK